MTTRLFRDDDIGIRPERDPDFDPVAEGARHRLGSEVSLAIWEYVSRQLTSYGSRDARLIQQCFQEVTTRIAARSGRLGCDIGGPPRVDTELDKAAPEVKIEARPRIEGRHGDRLAPRVPGRITLGLVEANRPTQPDAAVDLAEVAVVRSPPPMHGTLGLVEVNRPTQPDAAVEPPDVAVVRAPPPIHGWAGKR